MINGLPEEYLSYLKSGKQTEGFLLIEPGYFQLWQEHEVEQYNVNYDVKVYLPGMIGFGSNGGGEIFLFNGNGNIFMAPFVGMNKEELMFVANSWIDFVNAIENPKPN